MEDKRVVGGVGALQRESYNTMNRRMLQIELFADLAFIAFIRVMRHHMFFPGWIYILNAYVYYNIKGEIFLTDVIYMYVHAYTSTRDKEQGGNTSVV